MKVLLVNPPSLFPSSEVPRASLPLGLAYIASSLETRGHEVEVLDAFVSGWKNRRRMGEVVRVGMGEEEIRSRMEGFELVGVSCSFSSSASEALKTARLAREAGAKVVVGGVHASVRPEEVVEGGADFAVVGEGEETMLELVGKLERGESPSRVRGIVLRRGKRVVRNPPRPLLRNLDILPFPARHLFPMEEYFRVEGRAAASRGKATGMITSRGCPRRCFFCTIPVVWGCWRGRSPRNVVDEVEELVEEWGIEEVHFEDDNLTADGRRMRGICREMVRRKVGVSWAAPNGVEVGTLTSGLLEEMRRSGCYWLSFGLEHGDPLFRRRVGKFFSPSHARRVVRKAKELGIWTHAFFIVGWPWETKESLEKTFRFAEEVGLDSASFFAAIPLPGTPLERLWGKLGLETPDLVFHPHFRPMVDLETLKAEELGRWLKKAHRKFHIRRFLHWLESPRELLGRLGSVRDLLFFLRLARHFAGEMARRYLA
jgi:magnesium-protoporphyrin IX monomethyl ester (oxidative) cyclase